MDHTLGTNTSLNASDNRTTSKPHIEYTRYNDLVNSVLQRQYDQRAED